MLPEKQFPFLAEKGHVVSLVGGGGKTTLLYQRIRARAEKGEKSILLVPEQFTSSTEGRIYRELGDALSGMVESFSFTSLAEKILSTEGGAAVQTLSDAGRAVLVRRALEELQDNVHYYHRHRRSAAFCQMAAQTIDELKSAGLSGQQLAQLAASKGCVYLDLWEALADGEGNLKEMIAAPDGVHLSAGNGYGAWVTYLRNHAKYSASNPWIMGSAYSAE